MDTIVITEEDGSEEKRAEDYCNCEDCMQANSFVDREPDPYLKIPFSDNEPETWHK